MNLNADQLQERLTEGKFECCKSVGSGIVLRFALPRRENAAYVAGPDPPRPALSRVATALGFNLITIFSAIHSHFLLFVGALGTFSLTYDLSNTPRSLQDPPVSGYDDGDI